MQMATRASASRGPRVAAADGRRRARGTCGCRCSQQRRRKNVVAEAREVRAGLNAGRRAAAASVAAAAVLLVTAARPDAKMEAAYALVAQPQSPEELVELVASGEVDESELDSLIASLNERTAEALKGGNVGTAPEFAPSSSAAKSEMKGTTSVTSKVGELESAATSINGGVAAFRYKPPPQKQAPGYLELLKSALGAEDFFACVVRGCC